MGFYSAFLVADRVAVQTRNAKDGTQWYWESASGSHQYTVRPATMSPLILLRRGQSGF